MRGGTRPWLPLVAACGAAAGTLRAACRARRRPTPGTAGLAHARGPERLGGAAFQLRPGARAAAVGDAAPGGHAAADCRAGATSSTRRRGVCVDLSRFAVETLRQHRPAAAGALPDDRVRAGHAERPHAAPALDRLVPARRAAVLLCRFRAPGPHRRALCHDPAPSSTTTPPIAAGRSCDSSSWIRCSASRARWPRRRAGEAAIDPRCKGAPHGHQGQARHLQAARRRRSPVGQPDGAGADRRHAQGRRVPPDADRPGQAGPRPGEQVGARGRPDDHHRQDRQRLPAPPRAATTRCRRW